FQGKGAEHPAQGCGEMLVNFTARQAADVVVAEYPRREPALGRGWRGWLLVRYLDFLRDRVEKAGGFADVMFREKVIPGVEAGSADLFLPAGKCQVGPHKEYAEQQRHAPQDSERQPVDELGPVDGGDKG